MNFPLTALPALGTLSTQLGAAIEKGGVISGELEVVSRQANEFYSTFPSEVITCRFDDKREIRLFCKYSADLDHEAHGHRGGVVYEAKVYQQLLQETDLSSPLIYGIYYEPANNRTGLVLEYLADNANVAKAVDPDAMAKAARWIGRFHAICRNRVSSSTMSFLTRYDPDYYKGWAARALLMMERTGVYIGWIKTIADRFDEVADILGDTESTVIHGEYYSKNIMLQDGQIFPVDWESTAIGPGEIDLVTLIDGWPSDVAASIVLEYQRARWPIKPPLDFNKSMCAASIYIEFRWLSEISQWIPRYQWRIDALRRSAEEIGLI